jgi:HD-GYP domain-containing protein (c-di-GMP phosphodiesterase class II)
MTSDRPYRKAISKREAIAELKRCAGSQFDQEIVMAFVRILNGFIPEQIVLNRKRVRNLVCVEQYI